MTDLVLGAIRKARGYDVIQTPEPPPAPPVAPKKPKVKQEQPQKKPRHTERGANGKFVKKK